MSLKNFVGVLSLKKKEEDGELQGIWEVFAEPIPASNTKFDRSLGVDAGVGVSVGVVIVAVVAIVIALP